VIRRTKVPSTGSSKVCVRSGLQAQAKSGEKRVKHSRSFWLQASLMTHFYTREWWGRKILGKSFADFACLLNNWCGNPPKSMWDKLGLPVIEANLPGPTIHQCAVPWSTVELTAPRWGRSESLERSAQTHPAPGICKKKRCRTVNYHYSIRDFPWFTHFYICLVKFQYPFIIFSSYFIIWQDSAQAVS